MFLRPQHFQQHDRYLEAHVEDRCAPLQSYPWGIRELEFSEEGLKLGKIELNVCRGVMPDGTTFNIPKADTPPVSIELDPHTKDQIIYLSLLEKRPNATEVSREEDVESATRLQVDVVEVRDASMAYQALSHEQSVELLSQLTEEERKMATEFVNRRGPREGRERYANREGGPGGRRPGGFPPPIDGAATPPPPEPNR